MTGNDFGVAVSRLVIAAPSSGSGKTTLSMGLMAAFRQMGLKIQPYKVGPDYIDPAFHQAITGCPGINLDGWMLDQSYIKKMFISYAKEADLALVEGVMGLYDGSGDSPLQGSTAGIAKILEAPVVLVMAANGMAASAAAQVWGLREFGGVNITAVVINKPSSPNHYRTVKQAIEKHTGIKVIGFLPKTEGVELKSRHLGLVQSSETKDLPEIIERLAKLVREHIDLEYLLEVARQAPSMPPVTPEDSAGDGAKVDIAVAWDQAFSFYYHENLEILRRLGARLKFFSPLHDTALPQGCQGLYLGGGYPEVFAPELAANRSMRQSIKQAAEDGLPVYGECGGYMFLNRCFTGADGVSYDFTGVFDGEAMLTEKLQNFGYVELTGTCDTVLFHAGDSIRGHEFHKSLIRRSGGESCIRARKIKFGEVVEWDCGQRYKRTFGMYPHIYFPSNFIFAENFVRQCRAV